MTHRQRRANAALLVFLFPSPLFAQSPAPAAPPLVLPAAPPVPENALPILEPRLRHLTLYPDGRIHGIDFRLVYADELTMQADELTGIFNYSDYTASGNVRVQEKDTTLTAALLRVEGKQNQATAEKARLTKRPFTLKAETITATPDEIVAQTADLTTAPPETSPDISLRAEKLTLNPAKKRGEMRNVSLYLLHGKILTLRKVPFSTGGGSAEQRRQQIRPAFGASARFGTFIQFQGGTRPLPILPLYYDVLLPTRQSPQIQLRSGQVLYGVSAPPAPPATPPAPTAFLQTLRQLTTALPTSPLPQGDPLGFRDILPEPNPIRLFDGLPLSGVFLDETIASHIAARGNLRDDLYVSRLPEVTLSARVPLSKVVAPPPIGDSDALRRDLRHPRIYADVSETMGEYREDPTNLRLSRTRLSVSLSARPLLVAPNTVVQPRLSHTDNRYEGNRGSYRYNQAAVAISHYFSDRSALGLQFLAADVQGNSPFNFDVLDTSREMDVRLQIGDRHLTLAGQVRFDLTQHDVIDYRFAVAPGLNGFSPVFSYNFRTRSIGLGVSIDGLPF